MATSSLNGATPSAEAASISAALSPGAAAAAPAVFAAPAAPERPFASDAPGWSASAIAGGAVATAAAATTTAAAADGPVCWKCKGERTCAFKDKKVKGSAVVQVRCKVCEGVGRLPKKRKEKLHESAAGRVSKRSRRLPAGWVVPGPAAPGGIAIEMGEELCCLLGHWRIFQRVGGHRWSSDDLVTAWSAGRAWRAARGGASVPPPRHCLDLGCGIGSVLMMVAWQFPEARCLGVEAQERSAGMARRSLSYNGCDDRCSVVLSDMRKASREHFESVSPEDGLFDLITGTPPYFPVDFTRRENKETEAETEASVTVATARGGAMPSCEQSAPARFEFRGGVEAYCMAAKPRLRSVDSRFVVVEGMLDANHQRVLDGARQAGLKVLRQVDVHGRDDKPALFATYEMRLRGPGEEHDGDGDGDGDIVREALVIRHKGGRRSDAYVELMRSLGIAPPADADNADAQVQQPQPQL